MCGKPLWSPASPKQVLASVEADDESSYASLKSWACGASALFRNLYRSKTWFYFQKMAKDRMQLCS